MTCRYNKQESEFASKDEWDNYLEEREDISRILYRFSDVNGDEGVQMVLRCMRMSACTDPFYVCSLLLGGERKR